MADENKNEMKTFKIILKDGRVYTLKASSFAPSANHFVFHKGSARNNDIYLAASEVVLIASSEDFATADSG
ncbi:MAG: hypothetical protein WCD76_16875 [Pyrinomonadaceae bacterium]